jgi:hypothetical protein
MPQYSMDKTVVDFCYLLIKRVKKRVIKRVKKA